MSQFIGIEQLKERRATSGSVVVIDVLRAFSVAPLALALGARKIILVRTIEEALELKRETPGSLAITDGKPREGFELSNSPAALVDFDFDFDLAGRTLIQRTQAGTQGAVAVGECRALFCASFACASATAAQLRAEPREGVSYVVTGHGGTAAEDLACARFIDALIEQPDTDPTPYLDAARSSRAADALREGIRLGYKGIHPKDIEVSLQVDQVDFACIGSKESYGVVLERAPRR